MYDVAVIGAGLAGLAVSVHLSKMGFKVVCFEPSTDLDRIVGESLDWSAPDLFKEIDLEMEDLVEKEVSTYKRHVILKVKDGGETEYLPSPWLARSPLNVELRTLHVDRRRLHEKLLRIAAASKVTIIQDRVTGVERNGRTITAPTTAGGNRAAAKWFVDASGGAATVLAREFQLSSFEYGPAKVAMWSHFKVSEWQEGTTLYADATPRTYMDWLWEIPINPETISVGYVTTGAAVKQKRQQSLSVDDIYREQVMQFDRFREFLRNDDFATPHVTSFTCRVFKAVCGPNWVVIGEAASMPDPVTGNGVTAALRHAAEAAKLIFRFRSRGKISWWARAVYNLRVRTMGRFFNSLIEKLAYDWPVRDRLGLLTSGDVYTVTAWSINHLYSRLRPYGALPTALFSLFLDFLRFAGWLYYRICRLLAERFQRAPVLAHAGSPA